MKKILIAMILLMMSFSTSSFALNRYDAVWKTFSPIACPGTLNLDTQKSIDGVVYMLVTLFDKVKRDGCEGNGGWDQYLVVLKGDFLYYEPIGHDYEWMGESIERLNGRIIVLGKIWAETDAHCCPTVNSSKNVDVDVRALEQGE